MRDKTQKLKNTSHARHFTSIMNKEFWWENVKFIHENICYSFQADHKTMATMTGHLVGTLFTCCIEGSDEPIRNTRPRIDRSMIGQPMDFRHTAHIGQDNFSNNDNMGLLQTQMKSKGGYNVITNNVPYVPHIINARALDEVRRK